MSKLINIVQLVKELPERPRGRSCVVLTNDYNQQNIWSTRLAQQTNSDHINLLERFSKNDSLSSDISQFLIPEAI